MGIKPYKQGDYLLLLKDMRKEDRDEIAAAGANALKAVKSSVINAYIIGCLWDDEHLLCIFGINDIGLIPKSGSIWLMGTSWLKPRTVIEYMQTIDDLLTQEYDYVENWVYAGNRRALRTLKHLGYKIGKPEPHYFRGNMFRRISKWRG